MFNIYIFSLAYDFTGRSLRPAKLILKVRLVVDNKNKTDKGLLGNEKIEEAVAALQQETTQEMLALIQFYCN